ncbi:hypothetical protein F383_08011 [Gossypium arboreum]|uniref:Uncharacterized protein n=1 Tax=Gossypium arboreum TaxID=29729 RepID=A0A0B0MGP6_GOSAR|nr:hypothetical protein F383_08011 [Gossypium arboreum]
MVFGPFAILMDHVLVMSPCHHLLLNLRRYL